MTGCWIYLWMEQLKLFFWRLSLKPIRSQNSTWKDYLAGTSCTFYSNPEFLEGQTEAQKSTQYGCHKLEAGLYLEYPGNIYLFKVNNSNTRKRYEICSKLTIKTPERRHWRRCGVFIVNFKHISNHVLVFLLLTLNI